MTLGVMYVISGDCDTSPRKRWLATPRLVVLALGRRRDALLKPPVTLFTEAAHSALTLGPSTPEEPLMNVRLAFRRYASCLRDRPVRPYRDRQLCPGARVHHHRRRLGQLAFSVTNRQHSPSCAHQAFPGPCHRAPPRPTPYNVAVGGYPTRRVSWSATNAARL